MSDGRLLSAAVHQSPDAVVVANDGHRIVVFNRSAERIFGLSAVEAAGRPLSELFPTIADEAASPRQTIPAHRRNGTRFAADATVATVTHDGVRHTIVIVRDPDSERLGGRDLQRVLADVEAKEAQAAAADQIRREFIATVSHEIRTPMNGIRGVLDLLFETDLDSEQAEYLGMVRQSTELLLRLVNDVLDFAKLEAGRLTLSPVAFDLRTMLEDGLDLMAPEAYRRGLDLALHFDPTVPRMVVGDQGRIRQIALNLVGNAVKFTTDGHVVVRVTSRPAEDTLPWVRIEVEDTGPGVPEAVRGRLFARFVQAGATAGASQSGTGLGLAISHQLASLLGGRLGLDPPRAIGATFWVELPLAVAERRAQAATPALAGRTVLIAEPHRQTAVAVALMLQGWGARTILVNGVDAAARWFRQADRPPLAAAIVGHEPERFDAAPLIAALGSCPVGVLSTGGGRDPLGLPPNRRVERLRRPVRESQLRQAVERLIPKGPPPRPSHADGLAALQGRRVLVVDDNPINRRIAGRTLERLGMHVAFAANGADALTTLSTLGFEVVLLDCLMPVLDGFETTTRLRELEDEWDRRHLIIALTGLTEPSDRIRCLAAGMDDFLSIPLETAALEAVLLRHLGPDATPAPVAPEPTEDGYCDATT